MQKRRIIIGDYDTSVYGWTLAPGWVFTPAEQKTRYLDKPLGDGTLDLSTALTDGIPRYNDRELAATLELSEGTRLEREEIIRDMVNRLDGMRLDIRLPDDEHHHVTGRVHVAREYNDLAHAAVTVTAVCDPWKYADEETVVVLDAYDIPQDATLVNAGRRAVVPTITVTGDMVLLQHGTSSLAVGEGVHKWPELMLTPGSHPLRYSSVSQSTVVIAYREAVLE